MKTTATHRILPVVLVQFVITACGGSKGELPPDLKDALSEALTTLAACAGLHQALHSITEDSSLTERESAHADFARTATEHAEASAMYLLAVEYAKTHDVSEDSDFMSNYVAGRVEPLKARDLSALIEGNRRRIVADLKQLDRVQVLRSETMKCLRHEDNEPALVWQIRNAELVR